MRVAVLMGGWSVEREVSLSSGAAVAKACRALGHEVVEIDVTPDIAAILMREKPEVVFNALHGRFGEDGCIQGLLELLRIPYTHSGVLASALAMDKPMAKRIFAAAGIPCAQGGVFTREEILKRDVMARPYVVKPANEGSSVGVKLVFPNDDFFFTEAHWNYGASAMVEQYIPGREITVAVLDDTPLGVTEIRTREGFYDYEHKYTEGGSVHLCPAPLPQDKYDEVMELALRAHRALGCRGLSRSDFRYNEVGDGKFYILETNTQPGMTPLSLSPEIAALCGMDFNALVARLLQGARLDG